MRHISRTIILASTCLLASSLTAAEIYVDPIFNTQVTSNIVYGMGATLNGDIPLLLDIYEPTGPGAPDVSPLVVVIHGGGFRGGSKTNQRSLQQASELGEAGYRVASINYRTINDDPVPIPGPTDNWTETTTFEDRLPAVNPAIADATLAVQWLIDEGHRVFQEVLEGWWIDTGKKDPLLECNRLVLDTLERRVDGTFDDASRIEGRVVIEEGAERFPEMLTGLEVAAGGVLDPEPAIERALRFPGDREREVCLAFGELVSYLEFELVNHPRIDEPEVFLEAVQGLRERL